MIRRKSAWILGTSILVIMMFYNSCGIIHFGRGDGRYDVILSNPMAPVSSKILSAVCKVISQCNPQVTLADCEAGVLSTAGFAAPLGLSSTYTTFSSIMQGEQSGLLIGSPVSGSSCSTDISQLSCSSPDVLGAYDPTSSNPYAGSPNLITASVCQTAFSQGVNLQVPIELVDFGLSSDTKAVTFSRSRTSLNTSDYDGVVSYSVEVVASNLDTVSRYVSLVNSAGTAVGTLIVPAGTSESTRIRVPFVPTAGADNYRFQLEGTSAVDQLLVSAGRILVTQTGATQTRIFFPLIVSYPGDASHTDDSTGALSPVGAWAYSQGETHHFTIWKKNNAAFSQIAAGNPWTFEAVVSSYTDNTTSGYASLFNFATNQQVMASEVVTSSASPTLVSASFADGTSGFTDGNLFEVRIKNIGSLSYIYRASLSVKLTNLSHAEVYYRYGATYWQGATAGRHQWDQNTVMLETSAFSSPRVYNQSTAYIDAAGTPCTTQAFDIGLSDAGLIGNPVVGSTLNFSSLQKMLLRSSALTVPAGDRVIADVFGNNTSGNCIVIGPDIVVGF